MSRPCDHPLLDAGAQLRNEVGNPLSVMGTTQWQTIQRIANPLASDTARFGENLAFSADGAQDTGLYWGGDGYTFFTNNGVKSGEIQPGGHLLMVGNVTAYSDANLKENIVDATPKLNDLLQIKIRNFEWVGDESQTKCLGVIAQEVQSILPEVVTEAPIDNQYLTVWYERLIPLLIESIKELKQEIDELKK